MFDGLDSGVHPLFIGPAGLLRWADRVRPHLAKIAASTLGRCEASDYFAALAAGKLQLWLAVEGADILCVMVTEVMVYPRAKALRIIGLVGHQPLRWRHLLPVIERAAKERLGCTIMEAVAAPRYAAILPGYRPSHVFSEKVIG